MEQTKAEINVDRKRNIRNIRRPKQTDKYIERQKQRQTETETD